MPLAILFHRHTIHLLIPRDMYLNEITQLQKVYVPLETTFLQPF